MLTIVQKDGSTYGSLQGIITVSHSDFYSYIPTGSSLQGNNEDIDGTLRMEHFNGYDRPVTAQEAKGHGLKAWPYYEIKGGDGIKYFPSPSNYAEVPSNANDRYVEYKLVDIFSSNGLWDQRYNTLLFTSASGGFQKSYGNGNANAPWNWNDKDDGPFDGGVLATEPAAIVSHYYKNLGSFSHTYLSNKYKGIGY